MIYPYNEILFDNKKKSSTSLKIPNRITILIQQFHFRIFPKRIETLFKDLKRICACMFTATFTMAKRGVQVSIDGGMDKQNVYAYNETLFSLKKEGNLP